MAHGGSRHSTRCDVNLAGVRLAAILPMPPAENPAAALTPLGGEPAVCRMVRLLSRVAGQVLVVVDDFTRECLALVVDSSLSGLRVGRELNAIIAARGRPLMVVSDNGTELTSRAILQWQEDHGVEWHYIAPGKPMQNGFVEKPERPLSRRVPSVVGASVSMSVVRSKHPSGVMLLSAVGICSPHDGDRR